MKTTILTLSKNELELIDEKWHHKILKREEINMKKQDESKNQFRCMICDKLRLRGVFVKVLKGKLKGYEIKTCQAAECIDKAKDGLL